jgi:hypothetical protein
MQGAESAENSVARHSLLAELDARQDEVLAALDALNDKIEAVLRQAIPHDKLAEPQTEIVAADKPVVETSPLEVIRPLRKAA